MSQSIDRRDFIKKSLLTPAAGALAIHATQNQVLAKDTAKQSGAAQNFPASEAELPMGRIKDLKISRILLGGNLLTHFTHSRDLKYVYNLTAHYNTEEKIFKTLMLAEKAGINTINIGFASNQLLQKYKNITGSKIKVISQVGPDMKNEDFFVNINGAIDFGADIIQVQGNWCDWLVKSVKKSAE